MTDTPVAVTASESPLSQGPAKPDPVKKDPIKNAPVPAAKTGRAVAWFSLVLNLILVAAIAAAIWWLWPQWTAVQQQQQVLQQQQQQQTEQGKQQHQQLTDQLQQQLALVVDQQKQQGALDQQQQQALLQLQLESKKQLSNGRTWQLWQIQQLLQLAGQKIWLEQDMPAALRLLQGAEQQLALLQDNSMQPLRQAIQTDLAELQKNTLPDVAKIQLGLTSLRKAANDLPLRQSERELDDAVPVVASSSDWQSTLLQHWNSFWSSLVHVRPTQPEDLSVLSAGEQLSLRNTLQQQLLLAELAAMKYQSELYQAALQQAMDTLQRYFAAVDPKVKAASEQLVQLAALPVAFPAPAALQSSAVLDQVMRQSMVESMVESKP
ncbi:MAG TPA: uroporphyrinogen-III C-methyltransferase [Rheinheimera sp.]|jgi:uroporphyrin-III C-methyltransferase|uniref:uroporphyrinogen-III C-methyltransferase n=1 Tax=Rheinheimera sp. TaxID=1869214 RepID=UPI002B494D89|nr:uroporphyrinogen-III C-methyltransferase [Rheinheimera sp.]HJS13622.1 uroporphyrinogen-III C-methyltransferase [Rheinheimera sp.]